MVFETCVNQITEFINDSLQIIFGIMVAKILCSSREHFSHMPNLITYSSPEFSNFACYNIVLPYFVRLIFACDKMNIKRQYIHITCVITVIEGVCNGPQKTLIIVLFQLCMFTHLIIYAHMMSK